MNFYEIRQVYARNMSSLERQWKEHPTMIDPYFYDWASIFTPVEEAMWGEIRAASLPMFPQVPVLNYFVDFGNPFVKVAIECDGAQWHGGERDAKRDHRLNQEGWTIYRLPGYVCKKTLPCPAELKELNLDKDEFNDRVHAYNTTTARSVVMRIKAKHFER